MHDTINTFKTSRYVAKMVISLGSNRKRCMHDRILLYWFTDMPVTKPNDSCDEECVVPFESSLRDGWPLWP